MIVPDRDVELRATEELDPLLPSWAEVVIAVGGLFLLTTLAVLVLLYFLRRRRDR